MPAGGQGVWPARVPFPSSGFFGLSQEFSFRLGWPGWGTGLPKKLYVAGWLTPMMSCLVESSEELMRSPRCLTWMAAVASSGKTPPTQKPGEWRESSAKDVKDTRPATKPGKICGLPSCPKRNSSTLLDMVRSTTWTLGFFGNKLILIFSYTILWW